MLSLTRRSIVMTMKLGTIVKNLDTNIVGVVVRDTWGISTPNEERVVYDGSDEDDAAERTSLEVIGTYEARITDPSKCGMGMGKLCCRYLSVEVGGFACERFSGLRDGINLKSNMGSQGVPRHLFPFCQENIQADIASSQLS